jgi:hypothetical protein
MTFVRTITDKYGIEIIIDTTDNEDFVKIHSSDWKEIPNTATPGDFYHNGKAISTSDDDYSLIQEIIFNEVEKENVILRAHEEEERLKEEQERAAAQLELEKEEEDNNGNG